MYIRFVVSDWDAWSGAESGLFGPAFDIKNDRLAAPEWIQQQVVEELDWFNAHLDAPAKLDRRAGRWGRFYGICWFRPEAVEAINRARYMAWLLTEAGYPVLELRRDNPGEVLWQDPLQVVARPPRGMPRMFA